MLADIRPGRRNGRFSRTKKHHSLVHAPALGSVPCVARGSDSDVAGQASTTAYAQALKLFPKNADQAKTAAAALTEEYLKQVGAQRDLQAALDTASFQKQAEHYEAEISLIGATTAERNRELAVLRERQKLGIEVGQQANEQQQKALDAAAAAAAAADAQTQLQQLAQAQQELAGIATQAFDQVGQAITQAFVAGQGQAVNFGNVFRGIMTSVIQEVAKIAVLNPIRTRCSAATA